MGGGGVGNYKIKNLTIRTLLFLLILLLLLLLLLLLQLSVITSSENIRHLFNFSPAKSIQMENGVI